MNQISSYFLFVFSCRMYTFWILTLSEYNFQIFSLFECFFFIQLVVFFAEQKFKSWCILIYLFCIFCLLLSCGKKSLLSPISWSLSFACPSKSIYNLTFWCLILLELIFVYGVRWFQLTLLHVDIQLVFPHTVCWRDCPFPMLDLGTCVEGYLAA